MAVRDFKGKVVAFWSSVLKGSFSNDLRQLLALRSGLFFAVSIGAPIAFAEISSPEAASLINNSAVSFGDFKYLVSDIKALLGDFGISSCMAIPISGNSLAQNLASLSFSSAKEFSWVDPETFPGYYWLTV